jgi:hypothetical protein
MTNNAIRLWCLRGSAPRRGRPGQPWPTGRPRATSTSQPAVRHRLLLVAKRLEATPLFESTINADFRHFIGGGLKLEYHVNDMLSFGAIGVGSASIDTKLTDAHHQHPRGVRPDAPAGRVVGQPRAEKTEFQQHLNKLPFHGAAYVSVTPWYGKLAAFGKAFVNFDFYFQGGVAFALLQSSCDTTVCDDPNPGAPEMVGGNMVPDDNPNDDSPLNSGLQARPLPGRRHPRLPQRLHRDRPGDPRLRLRRQPVGRRLQRRPRRHRRRLALPAPPLRGRRRVDHAADEGQAHAVIQYSEGFSQKPSPSIRWGPGGGRGCAVLCSTPTVVGEVGRYDGPDPSARSPGRSAFRARIPGSRSSRDPEPEPEPEPVSEPEPEPGNWWTGLRGDGGSEFA